MGLINQVGAEKVASPEIWDTHSSCFIDVETFGTRPEHSVGAASRAHVDRGGYCTACEELALFNANLRSAFGLLR